MITVRIEIDEGPITLSVEFTDEFETSTSTTERMLKQVASAESAMVAALNAPPREATPR